jgi:regulator of sirC expression with transglutaminase-like and TPR domain
MFFPRLRRHAKWVFLFLAVAFGLGFVGFGVGAGGVGFGDILRGGSGSGIPSISEAQKRVSENPRDPKAFRDLATAAQADAQTDVAIEALEGYIALKPKDASVLRELAGLYLVKVGEAQQRYQEAELRAAYMASGAAVFQSINLAGRPLDVDAVSNAVNTELSKASNAALSDAQQAAAKSVDAYRRIAALTPDDPNVQLELGQAAESAGDYATATTAYKTYLKLVPANDATAREVRRLLKQLQTQTPG